MSTVNIAQNLFKNLQSYKSGRGYMPYSLKFHHAPFAESTNAFWSVLNRRTDGAGSHVIAKTINRLSAYGTVVFAFICFAWFACFTTTDGFTKLHNHTSLDLDLKGSKSTHFHFASSALG
jgi:hypothetical protein